MPKRREATLTTLARSSARVGRADSAADLGLAASRSWALSWPSVNPDMANASAGASSWPGCWASPPLSSSRSYARAACIGPSFRALPERAYALPLPSGCELGDEPAFSNYAIAPKTWRAISGYEPVVGMKNSYSSSTIRTRQISLLKRSSLFK